MSLPAPSLLAQLPRPLANAGGKIQFGEVHGLQGLRKRKRHEITAAIDGEGVNIYSAQFPKLVTSYAIPPQASHSCPPCSIRQKLSASLGTRRQTYCAVETSGTEIKCFVDETAPGRSTPTISTVSFPVKDTSSNLVFLSTIPAEGLTEESSSGTFDVIAAHKDGRLRRLSSDLKVERWTIRSDSTWLGREVTACFALGFEDARRLLLRKRDDIVASVLGDRPGTDSDNSTILVLVSSPIEASTIQLHDVQIIFYFIPAHVQADDISTRPSDPLKHLMTLNLPTHSTEQPLSAGDSKWSANFSTGELSLSCSSGFISFDITQFSPRVSSHVIIDDEYFSSIMRISSQSVIAGGKSTLSVYDAHYQTLQAELPLSDIPKTASSKKHGTKRSLEFISHFPKLNVLVGAFSGSLYSFDLQTLQSDRHVSRKRPRTSLLIDSVGKGILSRAIDDSRQVIEGSTMSCMHPVGLTQSELVSQWNELKLELDEVARSANGSKFDIIVAEKVLKMPNASKGNFEEFLPNKTFIDPEKIYYLISKIFFLKTAGGDVASIKLAVSFIPSKTFRWLVGSKHLSNTNIQAALRRTNPQFNAPIIPDGALIKAITSYDRSINTLLVLLRSPQYLEATELVHALCELLKIVRLQHNAPEGSQKTLTETAHDSVDKEASTSNNNSNATIINVITGLNLTLVKLHSHALSHITKSIRSILSNTDVLSIIHHLRHSLATGGHTSRFTEEPPAPFSSPKIPNLALPVIIDLLTGCIDAVGPSGWISAAGFAGTAGSEASLIADMKSEIAATLAAIDEATYLKGILREFIRCCETSAKSSKTQLSLGTHSASKAHSTDNKRLRRKERHNGAQILVYDTPDSLIKADANDSKMLPLSLKIAGAQSGINGAGDEVTRNKVHKATGEVRARSNREVAHLRRKAVGKYSFERIII